MTKKPKHTNKTVSLSDKLKSNRQDNKIKKTKKQIQKIASDPRVKKNNEANMHYVVSMVESNIGTLHNYLMRIAKIETECNELGIGNRVSDAITNIKNQFVRLLENMMLLKETASDILEMNEVIETVNKINKYWQQFQREVDSAKEITIETAQTVNG